MDKSLLELLEEEKKEMSDIRISRKLAADYIQCAENEEKEGDSESYYSYRIARNYEADAKRSEEKLIEIRKEIKQYLSFLMKI